MLWKKWSNICLCLSISVTLLCCLHFIVASETLFGFFKEKTPSSWIHLKFSNSLQRSRSYIPLTCCITHVSAVRPYEGVGPQVMVEGEQGKKWNHRSWSPVHLCLLPLTPSPIHHQRCARLTVAQPVNEFSIHCHWQERVNDRVKTCQPRSLLVCAVLRYSSAVHHHQLPADKEECNILLRGPDQSTTSYVWPRVVCNTPRSWFTVDMEPCDGEPSQAHRKARSSLWFATLWAPREYHRS